MSSTQAFAIANLIATLAWIVLIFMGRRPRVMGFLIAIPLVFAAAYTALIILYWSSASGGYGSINDVRALFGDDWLLVAGWLHYLAFDFAVSCWEVRDAQKHGLSQWIIAPSLALTFLFGPAGLLSYLLIRSVKIRTIASSDL